MFTNTPLNRWWPLVAAVVVAGGIGFALGRDGSSTVPAASGARSDTEDRDGRAEPAGGASPSEALEGAEPAVAAREASEERTRREVAVAAERATPSREVERREVERRASPSAPLVVAAGTRVELELLDGVSSQSAELGDAVRARLASAVTVGDEVALPEGTPVHGRVTGVRALRKVGGQAELALAFESVEVGGERLPIEAYFARTGRNETRRDAAAIAAGTLVGTVLGNQAKKNDRGKVVGGLVGAGVGTAIAAATEGEAIELGAGARLELTLRGDVEVRRGD